VFCLAAGVSVFLPPLLKSSGPRSLWRSRVSNAVRTRRTLPHFAMLTAGPAHSCVGRGIAGHSCPVGAAALLYFYCDELPIFKFRNTISLLPFSDSLRLDLIPTRRGLPPLIAIAFSACPRSSLGASHSRAAAICFLHRCLRFLRPAPAVVMPGVLTLQFLRLCFQFFLPSSAFL